MSDVKTPEIKTPHSLEELRALTAGIAETLNSIRSQLNSKTEMTAFDAADAAGPRRKSRVGRNTALANSGAETFEVAEAGLRTAAEALLELPHLFRRHGVTEQDTW